MAHLLACNVAQDFAFIRDVSISCTEKNDLVYVFRRTVDSHETEMMQIWLKQWVPGKWIFSP